MAVILMIQVHVMELFAQQDIFESGIGKLSLFFGGAPVAPLFLAIMGYYAFQSQKPLRSLIYRGVKLVLLGIMLNIGLNLHLLFKIVFANYQIHPLSLVFGVDILICAGCSIILIALLKKILIKQFWLVPVLIICVLIFSEFINNLQIQHPFYKYVIAIFGGLYKWSYFPIFPWLAYPLTGGLFFLLQDKIKLTTNYLLLIAAAGFVYTIITFKYAMGISHQLMAYYHHEMLFYFWIIGFLIFWTCACRIFEKVIGSDILLNVVRFLGKKVTQVYIVQWLIVGNIATGVYKSFTLIQSTLSFFIILIISFSVVYFIDKFRKKYLPFNSAKP